ncbi:hypothetical protein TSOC_002019 [Tetrabaena socialis]|uniref:Uncharacterized protein n=1 Tax=Tetrabaena socialis TaxID=47790 RepID=A0A2J8AF76_9CHLO|nr:hypothetical protein TSOC_002019 [Tetrabaena socialis]|eukprot:PNH11169.1 hypothetical protein TSOC_002019 [Tetrabaena socialis]
MSLEVCLEACPVNPMDALPVGEDYDGHVDWAFLPPPAMHVIGTLLPSSSVIKARVVNKHWASCLAGVVDTLYIVPEAFPAEQATREVPLAFPRSTTVNLDLQDTFMAVPQEVKDSLERYEAQRKGQPLPGGDADAVMADAAARDDAAGAAGPSGAAAGGPGAAAEAGAQPPAGAPPAAADAAGPAPPGAAAAADAADLVRIAMWSGIQKLDIKFPEHEREWHQEDAVVELLEFRSKLAPTPGAAVIASVLDNAPAAQLAGGAAATPMATDARLGGGGGPPGTVTVASGPGASVVAAAALPQPPTGAANTAGLTSWWSPLLPLLALPNMSDFSRPLLNAAPPPFSCLPSRALQTLLLENVELRRKETDCLRNLTSLERRTTCRHFPEFEGMPLQKLVVSNCCVKAKGITSIATECMGLTHLVFAVYKVNEVSDLRELQSALRQMVRSLKQLQVLKVRVLAGCITQGMVR